MPLLKRDEEAFVRFIRKVLSYADLEEDYIRMMTTEEHMKKWRCAFNHSTFSSTDNFELYEHRGDVIVNLVSIFYIKERYRDITSVAWLTKLKHIYQSGQFLNEIAERLGFVDFLVYGELFKQWLETSPSPDHSAEIFKKAKEDSIEAFFGCLSEVCAEVTFNEKMKVEDNYGLVIDISTRILFRLLDETLRLIKFNPYDYEMVFDATTRLKEAIDKNAPAPGLKHQPHWIFGGKNGAVRVTHYYYGSSRKDEATLFYHVKVYGFDNVSSQESKRSYVIAEAYGFERSLTQDEACRRALEVFKNDPSYEKNFGIKDVPKTINAPNQNKIKSKGYFKPEKQDTLVKTDNVNLVKEHIAKFKQMNSKQFELEYEGLLKQLEDEIKP